MINDRPPRDARPPTESQNVTDDTTRGIHVANRDGDATGRDFLGEGLSQLSSSAPRPEYPLTNTSGSDSSSSSHSKTFADPLQSSGSAFYESLRTFHDHHVPSPSPQGTPHEGWEEPSHASTTGLSRTFAMSPHVAFRMRHSDDLDTYVGPSGATQLHLGSSTSLLPSQGNIPTSSTLGMLPPTTFDDGQVASATYYNNMEVHYDHHESLTSPVSIPPSLGSHGMSEDPTIKLAFSHVIPRRWDDLPITGAYQFGSEQSLAAGAQNETPCGTAPLLRSPEAGLSRPSVVGSPFPNPSLTSTPAEFGLHYEQLRLHRISLGSVISTQNDAGPPSGYRLITSDDPAKIIPYLRSGKRKRSSDEDEGITRGLPRQRRNAALQGSAQDQPIPPPAPPRRIKIEQTPYVCGNSQHSWVRQSPVYFTVDGQPGIKLTDALDPHFPGPDGRDVPMFQYTGAGSSVSCRLNFLGYSPRSSQITTVDHKRAHNPRTRKKLAFEVAKRIKRYAEDSKVGIGYEKMVLVKLVHVSKASWQPEIWYDQEPVSDS